MKKILLKVLFLFFCIPYMQAQENIPSFNITGKIVDAKTNEALEYATIIFKPKGNFDVIGSITDKKGKFEVSVPKGEYTITLEFLGYKTKILPSQKIINDIHFGSIELSEDVEFLKDIEITGEKRLIERKLNKIVYNVSKDISADGSTINNVLNNIPSITVENDVPMIRGQESTVMINGKTSSMSKT